MDLQSLYGDILSHVYQHYMPWLKKENENAVQLIDPIDEMMIGVHYGETHMAAAFIIGGIHFCKEEIIECGIQILNSFLLHINEFQKKASYHWDFNNFALCCIYEFLKKKSAYPELQEKIKQFVMIQKDSKNVTINWLPMRLYVNHWKYQWTKQKKYKVKIDKLKKNIEKAQYQDGFIEDLLPKGSSFNFQYHLFTTAMLGFLRIRGIQIGNFDDAVKQAINIMDAQGDINYLGRGCNQIFAWGPALYLYNLLNDKTSIQNGITYMYNKSYKAIEHDNLILNDFDGHDKVWWWDYHYCSVYIAHFIFWLMLSVVEAETLYVIKPTACSVEDSGIHIHKENYCIVTFDGRKHYLAESGKVICNITQNGIAYFKGPFGPYYKEYGVQHALPSLSLHNYIGLLQQKNIFGSLHQKVVYPEQIVVSETHNAAHIELCYKKAIKGIVNLPWYMPTQLPVIKDNLGINISVCLIAKFKGPYGWIYLYQSRQIITNKIVIIIGVNHE